MFTAVFALMILDFADRQFVVAGFPALQAEWGLSDPQLGALVSARVGFGAFAALLVDGRSRVRAIGPVSAVVVDVVRPALCATAISTMAVVQNLVGLAVGLVLAGWFSDRYGLTAALAVLPLLWVYERDRAAVPVGGAPVPARPQHGQL